MGVESRSLGPGAAGAVLLIALLGIGVAAGRNARDATAWAGTDPWAVTAGVVSPSGHVEVRGLPPRTVARLVRAAADRPERPPLRLYSDQAAVSDPDFPHARGSVTAAEGVLVFEPHYPLAPGATYQVVLDPLDAPSVGRPLVLRVEVPTPSGAEPASVVAIFPSAAELPANQLKLYAHFSRPMRRWDPYAFIRLVDEDTGEVVADAFHAMRGGLWDASGTRLTVVFDPGRVKRGLANNLALGPPLTAGGRYRLVVDADWLDASGQPMEASFEKRFRVTHADRAAPDPLSWRIEAPRPGTSTPLIVRFPEPMDHALVETSFTVYDPTGRSMIGRGEAIAEERAWQFRPAEPWSEGAYELRVDPEIEDLAGNNVRRLFDVDLDQAEPATLEPGVAEQDGIRIPFAVEGPRAPAAS